MGYGDEQIADLEATIRATPCDLIVSGTPIDIKRVLTVDPLLLRARYELEPEGDGLRQAIVAAAG